MAKSRDFPKELHNFVKVINSFKGYWHDYDIFRDMVDLFTAGLSWNGDRPLATAMQDKYAKDFPKFQGLFKAYIFTLHEQLQSGKGWYDPLGTLYQALSSTSHVSWLGQFFTPDPICNMLAHVQMGPQYTAMGLKINDPACGSGRMLLAVNAVAPGNFLVGQDIDPLCAKMTCINLAMHGIQGRVICGDTLRQTWNWEFAINPHIIEFGSVGMPHPHIIPVTQFKTFSNKISTELVGKHPIPEKQLTNGKLPKAVKAVRGIPIPELNHTHIVQKRTSKRVV